jgi:hypothetical protein
MGAYNRLLIAETCSRCGSDITRAVQFKYGDVWQRDYAIGQALAWDGNNVGHPGEKCVMVSGHPEACPSCADAPNWTYDLHIIDDIIRSAKRREPGTEFDDYGHEPFVLCRDSE